MIQKGESVTLTSYSSPPKGETTHYILRVASAPSKCVRCAPRGRYHNPRPERPSNLRTLRTLRAQPRQPSAPQALSLPERKRRNPFTQPAAPAAPPFYNLRRSRHHNPRPERPSNLRTLRTFGTKSRQPSRRRRVLSYNPLSPHCDTIKQKPFFNDFRRDHGSIRSSSCAYRIQLV